MVVFTMLSVLPCWGAPEISINDISVAENVGSAVFTVSLSELSATPVTVDWAMQNGTAVESDDYTAGTGTVTFPANVQTQTITIPIINDTDGELAETFQVSLSNPSANATILDAQGPAVIQESDITLLSWDPGTADLGSVVQPAQPRRWAVAILRSTLSRLPQVVGAPRCGSLRVRPTSMPHGTLSRFRVGRSGHRSVRDRMVGSYGPINSPKGKPGIS